MFSVQNQPSLLKHAITPSFVYCILLQSLHTLAPSISLPFVLSIAIAQFMDLQEKCEIIHGRFLRQQCSFGTILYYTLNIHIIRGGNLEFATANKNNEM